MSAALDVPVRRRGNYGFTSELCDPDLLRLPSGVPEGEFFDKQVANPPSGDAAQLSLISKTFRGDGFFSPRKRSFAIVSSGLTCDACRRPWLLRADPRVSGEASGADRPTSVADRCKSESMKRSFVS